MSVDEIAAAALDIDVLLGRVRLANYIDGDWSESAGDQLREAVDPSTGRVITRFRLSSDAQVQAAIAAARRAFDGEAWRAWGPARRATVLREFADRIEAESEALTALMVCDIGMPVAGAVSGQITPALDCLRWFADAAERGPLGGYERPLSPWPGPGGLSSSVIASKPVGVVAALTAYNYPPLLLARKLGGAIAAGCTTVVLPSSQAQLVASFLLGILCDLGLPPGVVNVVIGEEGAGRALSTDPRVDMVTFTGSEAVGAAILAQGATTITKTVLELGGKSPNIVLPDADLGRIMPGTIGRLCGLAGQACGANTRIFVPRDRYGEFVDVARSEIARIRVGNPNDSATDVGPLISAAHRDRVAGIVRRAVEGGAAVLADSPASTGSPEGFYFTPVLIGEIDHGAELAQQEIFGPVGAVLAYDTVDEAVALANDTRFGLNANIWGRTSTALTIARRLRSGTVTINGGGGMRQDAGWGGARSSGLGREGGEAGFQEFFEEQHVQWLVDG